MTRKTILVLVVSSSGELQNGLLALTTTIPGISAVLVAEDASAALRMVDIHQPALIILDMFLLKDQAVIHKLKSQWPQIHLIVLVDNSTRRKEATEAGADSVLIKGFPAQKLVEIIETMIDCPEDTPSDQTKPIIGDSISVN